MQDGTANPDPPLANASSSKADINSYFILKRGTILLPSYGQDQQSYEKFWRTLTGEEKGAPVRLSYMEKDKNRNCDVMQSLFKTNFGPETPFRSNGDSGGKKSKSSRNGKPTVVVENGDDSKRLQEMTDHLRSLLHIGEPSAPATTDKVSEKTTPKIEKQGRVEYMKTPNQKNRSNSGSQNRQRKTSSPMNFSSPRVSTTFRASPSNGAPPRVPFTARTPKPPPFLPTSLFLSGDESDETTKQVPKFDESPSSSSKNIIFKKSGSFTNGNAENSYGDDEDDVVIWEEK